MSQNHLAAMKPTIAFLCLGNSCRSIMAEAVARYHHGSVVEARSAGLSPLGRVAPETLEVLTELAIPTHGLWSKGLREIDLAACRLVVNLTNRELGRRLDQYFSGPVLNRHILDPFGFSLATYRSTLDAIIRLLGREMNSWLNLLEDHDPAYARKPLDK
jgi:protein-tyrosine-phosphatase